MAVECGSEDFPHLDQPVEEVAGCGTGSRVTATSMGADSDANDSSTLGTYGAEFFIALFAGSFADDHQLGLPTLCPSKFGQNVCGAEWLAFAVLFVSDEQEVERWMRWPGAHCVAHPDHI